MMEDYKPAIEPIVCSDKTEDLTCSLVNDVIDNRHEPKNEVEYDNEPIVSLEYCDNDCEQDPLAEELFDIKDEFKAEELNIDDHQIKSDDEESNHDQWDLAQAIWSKQREGGAPTDIQLLAKMIDGCKTFCCPHCEYKTTISSSIRKHLRSHTGEKPFKCSLCSKSFSRAYSLNDHVMFTHKGYRPHKCSMCSFSCSNAFNLKTHMLIHTGDKPHKCTLCSYCSNKSSDLKRHMLSHSGHKPHKCSLCTYSSTGAGDLKKHMTVHSGYKPHKCTLCSKSFSRADSLNAHIMFTHNGYRPHKCSMCSLSFSRTSDLKAHMLTHTGDKPHKCTLCSYCSNKSSDVKRHMVVHRRPHK